MSPDEIRDLLLYAPRTEENYKRVPEDAGGLWFSKPSQSNIEQSKWGTYVRSTLIASITLYTAAFGHFVGNETLFLFIIIGYEFAYTILRREKNTMDGLLAAERYESSIDKYLKKRYPRYKPPE